MNKQNTFCIHISILIYKLLENTIIPLCILNIIYRNIVGDKDNPHVCVNIKKRIITRGWVTQGQEGHQTQKQTHWGDLSTHQDFKK